MRYELTDYEWTAIKPMLPNKPRGVPRVNDRRILNGIFWVLRSGAPRCGRPDDRHFDRPRASAWSMHQTEPTAVDGAITRRIDQQDSCGCRR